MKAKAKELMKLGMTTDEALKFLMSVGQTSWEAGKQNNPLKNSKWISFTEWFRLQFK
jgi:ubiquinone biosynthesis protein Coq4